MQKQKTGRHRGRRSRTVRLSELAMGRGPGRRRRSHQAAAGSDRPDGWQDTEVPRIDGEPGPTATAAFAGAVDIATG